MFYCSKIGRSCPYPMEKHSNYIFVIIPFDGFTSVYDIIKQSATMIKRKKFVVERADEKYTTQSIWCRRICSNIRKAKYCIVDTTGCNPNVFYELGFAHALNNTKSIIITQNIKEAPFDIREVGHIIYTEKDLPKLRSELVQAIKSLEIENQINKEISKIQSAEDYNITIQLTPEILNVLVNRTIDRLNENNVK